MASGFFATLLASGPSTPLSKYTFANGVLYLGLGASILAWPGQMQLLGAAPFQGQEEGLVRALGFTMMVIGWLYAMGARTRADSFGLATVVDRVFVPIVFAAFALTGAVDPHLVVPIAVLDPTLALGAYVVWRRSRSSDHRAR